MYSVALRAFVWSLQKPKDKGGGGIWNLWRRPELRWRSIVSCFIWSAFGFMYYGVILLSSKIMGDSDECSFDYSVLFLASSRCVCPRVHVNVVSSDDSLHISKCILPTCSCTLYLNATSFHSDPIQWTTEQFAEGHNTSHSRVGLSRIFPIEIEIEAVKFHDRSTWHPAITEF